MMIYTGLDVNIFNVIRYFSTSICLVPFLEWALQIIMESSGTGHLFGGGIVRWGGIRLGRLSPVPYSYNRKTRFFAMAACLLIHSASILGEIGFGAEQVSIMEPLPNLFRSNASTVRAYIGRCYEKELQMSFLTETPIRNVVEAFADRKLCNKRAGTYVKRLGYKYGVLNEELSSNINSVVSFVTEEDGFAWKSAACPNKGKEGLVRYEFSVRKSDSRKYDGKTIQLPLESANTTLFVPYHCDKGGYASMGKPTQNTENLTTLLNITIQNSLYLKQNKTFSCLGIRRFRGAFCFSNSTSTVRQLYRTIDGFHGYELPFETMYLFAEFDPPVETSRMYFILSGCRWYEPLMQRFTGEAMPEVLVPEEIAPEGSQVNYERRTKMVGTISKPGIAYLGLIIGLTLIAVAIALFSMILSTEDSRGRVVRVRSESKYVVDIVADEILAAENSPAPCVSDFGIALTAQGEGRHQILIEREGVPFKGGIIR